MMDNETLIVKLSELVEVLNLLRTELELCFDQGRLGDADAIAADLCSIRREAYILADLLKIEL